MKMLLLLLLCLAPQDQAAEARKLLDALAPSVKDQGYSQIEWENVPTKGVGHFNRGKAWYLDQTFVKGGQISVWDGQGFIQYLKSGNRFYRDRQEAADMLLTFGGGLAEIHYTGNAERLLRDAKKVLVKKEKLGDVDCTHVQITRKSSLEGGNDYELHFWIGTDQVLKQYQRRSTFQGKVHEVTFTYKVVDPPTTTDELFKFKPPADAKNMRSNDR